ncbi:hypothetical protein CHIBITOTORO_00520 [Serratia phage vB_SmaM-ChibiTotoro]|nr:hypothetical protein CHIBITOTORO_00520 [Serratia phage vB_SmaM-ChibiTotoro]
MKLEPQSNALKAIGAAIPQILGNNLTEFTISLHAEHGCMIHVVRVGNDGAKTVYRRTADSVVVFADKVKDVLDECERTVKQERDAVEAAQKAAKRQKDLNSHAREIAIQIGEFNEEIAGYEARLQTNLKAKAALESVNLNHTELDRRVERDRAAISTLKIGRDISQENLGKLYEQGAQRYYTNGEPFNGDPEKAEPVKDPHAHAHDSLFAGFCDCGCGKALINSAFISDGIVSAVVMFEPSPSDESDVD